jgi:methionine sulfoxide reductase heme-binding subunit
MSHGYRAIQWTPFKRTFDLVLALGLLAFVGVYVAAGMLAQPEGQSWTPVQLLLRATGSSALALLTLILLIGPLARLNDRFKPLLYNRRHLGVTCFLLALVHAALVVFWYHGFSHLNPFVSLLVSNPRYGSIGGFPFESLGLLALLILLVMAATSHDFWNANLGPGVWKAIHMSVYVAYPLLVAHVFLGAVQAERGYVLAAAVGGGALLVAALHLATALHETARDSRRARLAADGWLDAGPGRAIPDKCAHIVVPPRGERIAVFRDGDRIHAISNVCRHQGGPLGEGRIVDGCVVCPWHGFQYRPEDGRAPAPFSERVSTYRTRVEAGIVFVHPDPEPPGTAIDPSVLPPEGTR